MCLWGLSRQVPRIHSAQRGIEVNPEKVWAIIDMQALRNTKEVQRLAGRVAALNRFISRSADKCSPFFRLLKKAFHWDKECNKEFNELKVYLAHLPTINQLT